MGKRRDVCFSFLAVATGLSLPRTLHAASISIGMIGEIFRNAGSAVKSVAEGIEAAYKAGTFIIDDQQERKARDALKKIESKNSSIIMSQASLLFLIRIYTIGPDVYWDRIRDKLVEVGELVQSSTQLLRNLAPKLPPKISEQISQLATLYQGRTTLIDQLRSLPKPSTQADLDSLKYLGQQWAVLHTELVQLNVVLDNILSKSKSR